MIKSITIQDWLDRQNEIHLLDVRTPAEFTRGHVPGAINLPIFSNEERVAVGTTYKQQGRDPAILLGFEIVGPKWASFIRTCLQLVPSKKVAVHCWRGGMRSAAMAWALDMYGFEVHQVKGGYKQFRSWTREQFGRPYHLKVLGGMTGSGKTRLLQLMSYHHVQAVDLEELAQHQGSTYGTLNKLIQPTQEQFENNLAWILKDIDPAKDCWFEDECQMIGRLAIPMPLWNQVRIASVIDLQVPLEQRVTALVNEYGTLDADFLIESTARIKQRLGPQHAKTAITAIRENRMDDFIRTVLVYYDKMYKRGLEKRDPGQVIPVAGSGTNAAADLELILAAGDAGNAPKNKA